MLEHLFQMNLYILLELLFRLPHRGARGNRWWLRRIATLAPIGLALFGYVALRTIAIEDWVGRQPVLAMDNVLVGMEGLPRLATALGMAARYAGLLFLPLRLSGDYSGNVIAREESLLAPAPLLGAAFLLFLLLLMLLLLLLMLLLMLLRMDFIYL